MTAKPKTTDTRRKKPRRRIGDPSDIMIVRGGAEYPDNKHLPRRRNPAKPRKTANDVMFDAWEYTYNTRRRRLTTP